MNFYNFVGTLITILFLTSCAPTGQQQLISSPHEMIKCSVFEVMSGKTNLGTGFFFDHEGKIFAITASHTLLAVKDSTISIRPACTQNIITIKSHSKLGVLDAAIMFPEKIIPEKGIIAQSEKTKFATKVFGVSFPNLQIAEPRLKGLPIPTSGLLVEDSNPDILVTMDVVQLGSSGSPIVNYSGKLIGMLTNRVLVDGNYAGVSYGISEQSLQSAISNHFINSAK